MNKFVKVKQVDGEILALHVNYITLVKPAKPNRSIIWLTETYLIIDENFDALINRINKENYATQYTESSVQSGVE